MFYNLVMGDFGHLTSELALHPDSFLEYHDHHCKSCIVELRGISESELRLLIVQGSAGSILTLSSSQDPLFIFLALIHEKRIDSFH